MLDVKLSRRSVLALAVAVGLVAAGAGAGTMELFSSTATSTGNTIQAGTLTLGPGISDSFLVNGNIAPTQSVSGSENISNTGSLNGNVSLSVSYVQSDNQYNTSNTHNMTAAQTAKQLDVTTLTYGGTSVLGNVNDSNGDGTISLYELKHSGNVQLGSLSAGSSKPFNVTLTMNQSAGNKYQNDGVNATFTFHLEQAS